MFVLDKNNTNDLESKSCEKYICKKVYLASVWDSHN